MEQPIFEKARALQLPIGSYALFASAPIAIRNLREANDLDIVVTPELLKELRASGKFKIKKGQKGDEGLCINDIELWDSWWPGEWDVERLIKEADIINGLPFVQLKEVARWKELANREKDKSDLLLIKNYLKTQAV